MFASLNASLIGIQCPSEQTIDLAVAHGFAGVDLNVAEVDTPDALRDRLDAASLRRGLASGLLPGKTTASDAEWDASLDRLPTLARQAAAIGFERTMCVLMPFHEDLPFEANWAVHIDCLRRAGDVLIDHGIRVGLEYVSPVTRRAGQKHAFLFDLAGTMRLIDAVNSPAVGLMLDSFHWHCASESADDIRELGVDPIVGVHVNDAVAGRGLDEQNAFERELPGATGVIGLPAFFGALEEVGYAGPVIAEPMNAALNQMPPDAAVSATARAMEGAFAKLSCERR